jgi:mutator protein MutT
LQTHTFESFFIHIKHALAVYQPEVKYDESSGRYRLPGREHLNIPAAVMILIYPVNDTWQILLTKRPATMRDHAGQIAFPGGKIDSSDGTPEQAALRELSEEVGVTLAEQSLVGRLPTYEVATGYAMHPIVALLDKAPPIAVDFHEVAEVFSIPLDYVLNQSNFSLHHRDMSLSENKNRRLTFYTIDWQAYHVWGATAAILLQLSQALSMLAHNS